MQQIPPLESPLHMHQQPAEPVRPAAPEIVPTLPGRRGEPGRAVPLPDLVAALGPLTVPDSAPPFDGGGPDSGQAEPAAPAPAAALPATESRTPGHAGWPSQFAQVLAETLAGSRPAQQVRPWTTEQTRQRIRQLTPLLATGQQPRVRRIMSSAPSEGVLELTAVVGFGPRIRVLALRLERIAGSPPRWQCTALESA